MKKLSAFALAAFLLSLVPAIPSHAQDTSSCKDCAVGDPYSGKHMRKKGTAAKTPAASPAPSSETAAPKHKAVKKPAATPAPSSATPAPKHKAKKATSGTTEEAPAK